MRIPLPVFYFSEDSKGRLIVIDGRQNLLTFENFVNNNLKLNLPRRESIDSKTFDQLNQKNKN